MLLLCIPFFPVIGVSLCIMCSRSLHLLGPHWHNCYEKDRRLPLNADGSGESTSNDSGDHRQRPRPRPHWAHLLAVHKRGTRTQTQVSTNTFQHQFHLMSVSV